MSLLDTLTGGKNQEAQEALDRAAAEFSQVPVPTTEQLTLPQLQKYVEAGVLTPAEAQAMLVKGNAYEDIPAGGEGLRAEEDVLSRLNEIATSGGMDAMTQAKLTAALNQVKTKTQGQRGLIEDQMAARGIPTSLMAVADQNAAAGQDNEAASAAGVQAVGEGEQRALQALSGAGTLGGNIQAEQYDEASKKAAAENAIKQWNAQNQTGVNLSNAGYKQAANTYDAATKQDTSNKNVESGNARTVYNAAIPETIFGNQMTKASGEAGVQEAKASADTAAGQQQAGLIAGLMGGASTIAGDYLGGKAATASGGGRVPGTPEVPGDSLENDKVHAILSPGEVVVPRSIAPHPEMAKEFVRHVMRNKTPLRPVHPDDVHSLLSAMTRRREGEAA